MTDLDREQIKQACGDKLQALTRSSLAGTWCCRRGAWPRFYMLNVACARSVSLPLKAP
jgi:hypothetical protein